MKKNIKTFFFILFLLPVTVVNANPFYDTDNRVSLFAAVLGTACVVGPLAYLYGSKSTARKFQKERDDFDIKQQEMDKKITSYHVAVCCVQKDCDTLLLCFGKLCGYKQMPQIYLVSSYARDQWSYLTGKEYKINPTLILDSFSSSKFKYEKSDI